MIWVILWFVVGICTSVYMEVVEINAAKRKKRDKEYRISDILWFILFTTLGPIILAMEIGQNLDKLNIKLIGIKNK